MGNQLTNHRHQVVDRLDSLGSGEQVHDQIAQVAAVVASHLRKNNEKRKRKKEEDNEKIKKVRKAYWSPAPCSGRGSRAGWQ